MKNKTKILSLLVITLFALVMSLNFSSAAVSLIMEGNRTFVSNTVLQGFLSINITVNGSVNDVNMTNCSLWGKSNTLTANTTYVQIAATNGKLWEPNGTAANLFNDTNFTVSWNTSQFEDANDYKFKAICSNSSDGTTVVNISSTEITGVTIDNTVPEAPSSMSPTQDNRGTSGTVNFSATIVDSKTTSCTVTIGPDTYTAAYTGVSCSYQKGSIPSQTYEWYITLSDASNTTRGSTMRYTIDIPAGTGKRKIAAAEQVKKEQSSASENFLSIAKAEGPLGMANGVWMALGAVATVLLGAYIMKRTRQ